MILLFRMASEHSAEVPSSVPKRKKAMICLMEQIHMLGKIHSGMSYSAVGHEFDINESTTYIKYASLSGNTYKTRLYILS